jgi:nitrous oxide reductase accessory protein NosL
MDFCILADFSQFINLHKTLYMIENFPIEYTLESGTRVVVNKTGTDTYDFSLKPLEKSAGNFIYIDDGRPKAEWDESLDFEQLEALRTFWLMNEEVL